MEQEQVFLGSKTTLYHFGNAFQAVLLRPCPATLDRRHQPGNIFHSTNENLSTILQLTIIIRPEIIDGMITGDPGGIISGKARAALTIGVEFQVTAEDELMPHLEQVKSKQ